MTHSKNHHHSHHFLHIHRPPLSKVLPFLTWKREITRATMVDDLMAGLTVAMVSIPAGLAYGELAGLPPQVGLYASFLPPTIAVLFGSSRVLSTGPVAVVSLLTAAALGSLGITDALQLVSYAVLLAVMVGVIQLTLGFFRLGVIVHFISHPVVIGFINAAGLIIASSQFPKLLGVKVGNYEHYYETLYAFVIQSMQGVHWPSVVFSVVGFGILYGVKRLHKSFPAALIAMVVCTWLAWVIGFDRMGGSIVGNVPAGVPPVAWLNVDFELVPELFGAAAVIAILGFMESVSIARTLAVRTGEQINPSQELVGQGFANIASAIGQGYPVSGSFSRSAVNYSAGARTGMSSVFTSVFVLLTLLFLTPLLYYLPQPLLAVIIILSVVGMLQFGKIVEAWRTQRSDGVIAGITFVATLFFAPHLDNGLLVGILLSIGYYIYSRSRPRIALLHLDKYGNWIGGDEKKSSCKHMEFVRFDGSLFFANASYLQSYVLHLVAEHPRRTRVVVLVASGINYIDYSGVEALRELVEKLREAHKEVVFVGLKGLVVEKLKRSGVYDLIGADHKFHTESAAIRAFYEFAHGEGHEDGCEVKRFVE